MYTSYSIIALTALSVSASGLALPSIPILANQPCQYKDLKSNQSAVFGWQLAGAALNTAEKGAICNNLLCFGLINAGLDALSIKAPSCSPSNADIDAASALPNIVQASSRAFMTMLTNSIPQDNEDDFLYLCDNIRFIQLRSFMLNDAQIVNATCNKAGPGAQISPQPFTAIGTANDTAVAEYKISASKLFAHNYAATATSRQQLRRYCNRASSYNSNFDALELDSGAVSQELCRIRTVPTISETQNAIKKFSSQQFITVVQNMSNVPGWKKWLCEQLDQDAMDRTGLDGGMIKEEVCASIQASS